MIFEFAGRYYRRLPTPVPDHPGFGRYRLQIISLGPLSNNALKVYERLIKGHFYQPHSSKCPKAMQELIDAGLVGIAGRVVVIERCYVPAHGYTPYVAEKFK